MNVAAARGGMICAILAGCGAQAWAMFAPLLGVEAPAEPMVREPVASARTPPPPDSLVGLAIGRPMFRAGRRPAAVEFDPARPASPEVPIVSTTPKPVLLVSGIAWGSQPAAVIEGLPGIEGFTVLRKGESASGIRVVRIERERVFLRGLDTTWSLPVREPWQ